MTAHLKIQYHLPGVTLPQRAHPNDAGFDLTAWGFEQKRPEVFLFDTGISIQISEGYYTEIVPRSSIIKTDFLMANSVGIIDPDYRGRLLVPLRYIGSGQGTEAAQALIGQRIAQLLVRRWEACTLELVENLEETRRGQNGFGSTGV